MRVFSRARIAAVLIAAALVGCGGGSGRDGSARTANSTRAATAPGSTAVRAGSVVAVAGPVQASMQATTHAPRANTPWPLHFVVTNRGTPARASVRYQFLLSGQVVARRSHYRFTGRFSDIVVWPASAVGYPLTFRAVVDAGARTLNLDYPVTVTR